MAMIFFLLQVEPKVIYLSKCRGDRKPKEALVSLRPHLPIRGRPLTFEVGYNSDKKICILGDTDDNLDTCLSNLTTRHSIYRPLWMKIIAICSRLDNVTNSDIVEVKFSNPYRSYRSK